MNLLSSRATRLLVRVRPAVLNRQYSAGLIDSIKGWLGDVGRRATITSAKHILQNCQLQAGHPFWQLRGGVGSDFRSRHLLLVLHVWMVHKRLMQEGREGLRVQEALFDELWEDSSQRLRAQGVGELSVNARLKEVQSLSFRCCVDLDHALCAAPASSGQGEGEAG
ncbi:hypothetical protein EON64_17360, partial [archaeon]